MAENIINKEGITINGLDLTEHVTSISKRKTNSNSYSRILRHKSPIGMKSGKALLSFTIDLAFPNAEAINNKLRYLVAHFKMSPFVKIDSQYIASIVQPEGQENSAMAVTLNGLTIRTEPGLPESVFATLDVVWFNYYPYSADYSFKNRANGVPVKVSNISDSDAYQKRFKEILESIPKVSRLSSDVKFYYNDLVYYEPPAAPGGKSIREQLGKELSIVTDVSIRSTSFVSKLDPAAGSMLKQVSAIFYRRYRKQVPVDNMFVSVYDFNNNDTVKAHEEEHNAGIAFDILLLDVVKKSNQNGNIRYLTDVALDKEEYKGFVEIAGKYGFKPASDSYGANGSWHFKYTSSKLSVGSLSEKHNAPAGGSKKIDKDYQEKAVKYSRSLKNAGYRETGELGVWAKQQNFFSSEDDNEMAIVGLAVTLQNTITTIPILGHEYPTHQYMGGVGMRVDFSIQGIRQGKIGQFQKILNTLNQHSVTHRRAENVNNLIIDSTLTNLVSTSVSKGEGFQHAMRVLVDSSDLRAVEGSPDLDSLTVSCTEYAVDVEHISAERLNFNVSIRERILSVLKTYLYVDKDEIKKTTSYVEDRTPGRLFVDVHPYLDPVKSTFAIHPFLDPMKDAMNEFIDDANRNYRVEGVYGVESLIKSALKNKKELLEAVAVTKGTGRISAGISGLEFKQQVREVDPKENADALNKLRNALAEVVTSIMVSTLLQHEIFKGIYDDITKHRKESSSPCYPDLDLPVVEGESEYVIDTDPDYYYWNEDSDGRFDEGVIDAGKKIAKQYAGNYGDFASNEYSELVETMFSAEDKTKIPTSSTRTKLGQYNNDILQGKHEFSDKGINFIFDKSKDSFNGSSFTMKRAFPTFKVYFIEDDTLEDIDGAPIYNFDDYFGYNAISDIKVIKSRKNPVDLCILRMTNFSGKLSSKLRYSQNNESVEETEQGATRDTAAENPLDAILLKPGQSIQVRMGYSNDPDELEIVFNGFITEVGGEATIEVVCQSYTAELVRDIKGIGPNSSTTERGWNIFAKEIQGDFYDTTQEIFEELLDAKEVVHFGSKKRKGGDHEGNTLYEKNEDPKDDNVFIPDVDTYDGSWDWIIDKLDYRVYYKTIWEVFKEMELRHPGWVCSAVPYGNRMTLFFGVPTMGYWHKPEEWDEFVKNIAAREKYRREQSGIINALSQIARPILKRLPASIYSRKGQRVYPPKDEDSLLAKRFVPFRKYHYLSDNVNMISNDIVLSSDKLYNTISVQYVDDVKDSILKDTQEVKYESGLYTLAADVDIKDQDRHTYVSHEPNCEGEDMAKRYALGLLIRHMKDMYSGTITILGDPTIKPYDQCFINDEYSDMFGPIEVEQVVHHFSHETGFITEITPDLVVSGNEFTTMTFAQVFSQMGLYRYVGAMLLSPYVKYLKVPVAAAAVVGIAGDKPAKSLANDPNGQKQFKDTLTEILRSLNLDSSGILPLIVSFITRGLISSWPVLIATTIVAIFLSKTFISYSQDRQPVTINPLVVGKEPYLAGLKGFEQNGIIDAVLNGFIKSPVKDLADGAKALLDHYRARGV